MKKPLLVSRLLKGLFFSFWFFLLGSCLEQRLDPNASKGNISWFDGIKSVQNLGGSPAAIRIEWNRSERTVTAYRVYSLIQNPITRVTQWTLQQELTPDQLIYINSGLTSGQVYSYQVQAVTEDGLEDGNSKALSTVAFEGIGQVQITGKSTAIVTLNSPTGAFDEVRIYATPKNGGVRTLVGTAKGLIESIPISNLRSGVHYRFSANAFMRYLNAEDGNRVYVEAQTHSDSFGSGASNDSAFQYRNFLNVQAFGSAPNAPSLPSVLQDPTFSTRYPTVLENPKARLVRLTWLPFTNSTAETRYKVVRSSTGFSLNMATIVPCSPSLNSSCVVCTITGQTRCEDTQVDAPPKRYDYAVSLLKQNPSTLDEWAEELPIISEGDFKISVHIPPDNMVLVQRDAANYEMCQNMRRSSDPRRHQRCVYTGMGERPFNTGPGKPAMNLTPGFYDFGYNLFMDRYRLACNWTQTPGACDKAEGCIEIGWNGTTNIPPNSAMGQDGDVMFRIGTWVGGGNLGNCYLKKNGNWLAMTQANLTAADYQTALTIDPGPDGLKRRPVLHALSQNNNFFMCQSFQTPYGFKRLVRRREHIVASALPLILGEPNYIAEMRTRIALENGINGPREYECGMNTSSSQQPTPSTLSQLLNPSNARSNLLHSGQTLNSGSSYFSGRQETIRCQSRFGIHDVYINSITSSHFADTFIRTNPTNQYPMILRGETSEFDSGAVDFNGFVMDNLTGVSFNGVAGSSQTRDFTTANIPTIGNRYIMPLGVPIVNWLELSQQDTWSLLDLIWTPIFGGHVWGLGGMHAIQIFMSGADRFSLLENRHNRWGYTIRSINSIHDATGTCALEAE
jgi:hypothetical protein